MSRAGQHATLRIRIFDSHRVKHLGQDPNRSALVIAVRAADISSGPARRHLGDEPEAERAFRDGTRSAKHTSIYRGRATWLSGVQPPDERCSEARRIPEFSSC